MNIITSVPNSDHHLYLCGKIFIILMIAIFGTFITSVNFGFSADCDLPELPDQYPFEEPPPGNPCETPSQEDLVWDANNGKSIEPGQQLSLAVSGGIPPYVWQMDCGEHFYFANNSSEITTSIPGTDLFADSNACGSCTVTVSDQCDGSVNSIILSTSGVWKTKYYYNGDCGSYCSCTWGPMGDSASLFNCSDSPCSGYSYEEDMRYYFEKGCLRVTYDWQYDYLKDSTCAIAGAELPGVPDDECSSYSGYQYVVPWLKFWRAAVWVCPDTVVELEYRPN